MHEPQPAVRHCELIKNAEELNKKQFPNNVTIESAHSFREEPFGSSERARKLRQTYSRRRSTTRFTVRLRVLCFVFFV